MIHSFTVDQTTFEALQSQRRHLFVKDSTRIASGDQALINSDGEQREQLSFVIVSIDHGPESKHVNGRFCLLGLYTPYRAVDDVPESVGGGAKQQREAGDGHDEFS